MYICTNLGAEVKEGASDKQGASQSCPQIEYTCTCTKDFNVDKDINVGSFQITTPLWKRHSLPRYLLFQTIRLMYSKIL